MVRKIRFVFMKTVRFFLLLSILFSGFVAVADAISPQQYRAAKSRKVGHEVLLWVGDSSSTITSVLEEGNRYTISFPTEFSFKPEVLMSIADSVLKDSRITTSYFLEVLSCADNSIVYNSFRAGPQEDSLDIQTCNGREYDTGCYKIALTFIDVDGVKQNASEETQIAQGPFFDPSDPASWGYLIGTALLIFSGYAYFRRKKEQKIAEHIIPIGAYIFDQRNMHLTFNGETVELTSKEADLLFLLHSSKNETVERDTILRIVWGDEGDYVGRTLDVFISKLRKKLAEDPAIKIANIRGVGYRLVVDSSEA